jgi:tetratricopeptide (TPR) repeat protein
LFVAAAIAWSSGSAARAEDAMSIPELMAAKKAGLWAGYAQSQASMKIEGRYAVISSTLLRFLKCEGLNFVWFNEEESFPIDPAHIRNHNLEVFGHFETRSDKPTFVVRQILTLPSDADALRTRKTALFEAPVERWYELGDWASSRGAFYGDPDLAHEAKELYAEAVRRERRLLPNDALDRRLALAKKYPRYGLPEDDRLEFVHESLALRWQLMKDTRASAQDLDNLCDRISENLRGCKVPLTPQDEALRKRSVSDLVGSYRTAPATERLRMNRALWAEVRSAFLDAWAKERNRDPLQLADRIDRELPEQHARAEALRSGALDQRLADVVRLSRDDLLNLVTQFQQRGQPEKALQAKRAWVKAKEERLTHEGSPSDLVQAAREYLSLLDDTESAARLLIAASKSAPDLKEIGAQLERLGYRHVNGKWLTAVEIAALPVDPLQKAAETGRYVGMTREQIRKAIGVPDSRTRIVASGRLSEVWIYSQDAKSRLAIHFVGSADGHDVTAVRVDQ